MDVDFVIPLSKDDLLSGEAGSYVVDEILSVRVLPNKLRGRSILIKTETSKALNRHAIMKGHFLFSFQYHVIIFSLPSRPSIWWTTSYRRKFRLLFQRFKVSRIYRCHDHSGWPACCYSPLWKSRRAGKINLLKWNTLFKDWNELITLLALWYKATRNTSPLGLQETCSGLVYASLAWKFWVVTFSLCDLQSWRPQNIMPLHDAP